MTIFIVETPHQKPPTCWTAESSPDAITSIAQYLLDVRGEELAEDADFDDAIEAIASDLQSIKIYASTDEAAQGYLDGWEGHQSAAAMAALLKEVMRHDYEIADPALRLRIVGAVWDAARDTEREIAGTAYDAVKEAAFHGMSEVRIAELLGVNRGTVRTALGK